MPNSRKTEKQTILHVSAGSGSREEPSARASSGVHYPDGPHPSPTPPYEPPPSHTGQVQEREGPPRQGTYLPELERIVSTGKQTAQPSSSHQGEAICDPTIRDKAFGPFDVKRPEMKDVEVEATKGAKDGTQWRKATQCMPRVMRQHSI